MLKNLVGVHGGRMKQTLALKVPSVFVRQVYPYILCTAKTYNLVHYYVAVETSGFLS